MSYSFCSGCEIELRNPDQAYACDHCWQETVGRSPHSEWKKFTSGVDVIPSKGNSCDFCHRRNIKWLANTNVCNACFIRDYSNFKEDVTNNLKFLRDLHPSPASKDFIGDVTFVVPRTEEAQRSENDPNPRLARQESGDGKDNPEKQPLPFYHGELGGATSVPLPSNESARPWSRKAGPTLIQAHRFILASKSPIFRKMFEVEATQKWEAAMLKEPTPHPKINKGDKKDKNEAKEEEEDEALMSPWVFKLDGVGPDCLRAAINFMYTAEIQFNDKVTALDVLKFAHEYEILWLKTVCEIELTKRITSENLSEMLQLSYKMEADNLKRAAKKFFEEHPQDHNTVLDSLLILTSCTSKS